MEMDEHLKEVNKLESESIGMKIYKAILEISGKLDDILEELQILKHK